MSRSANGGQSSGVNEGDHDVASALCDPQALVPVGEPAGVHEGPPDPGLNNTAVVAQEPAATALAVGREETCSEHTCRAGHVCYHTS